MTGKIRQRWQVISWRTVCFLCVIALHAWGVNSPLLKKEISSTAHQQQSTAVSLSFTSLSAQNKSVSVEKKKAHKKSPPTKKIALKKPITIPEKTSGTDIAKIEPPITTVKDNNKDNTLSKTETLATEINTSKRSNNDGIHNELVISKPLFDSPPTPPNYPTVARKRGQQGIVWLEIWLDEWGKQSKLSIVQSSGVRVLDQAALNAVSSWHFQPHKVNGSGTSSRVRIPVEFALN